MASIRANVNAELLAWARRTAGLTLEDAARKINNVSPDRLSAWEEGADRPTVKQLYKMAEVYKRPLGTFFLSELPKDFTIPRDFRRLPGEVAGTYSPALLRQIRFAEERRGVALELFEELGDMAPEFTLSATLDEDPDRVAKRIRNMLGVTFAEQVSWRDPQRYRPLKNWRSRIEQTGILVFQVTDVDPMEMLGFSFAEPVLPVIAINRRLRPNGRIFTMLHEFVHLTLSQSGLCDLDEEAFRPPEEQRIEVFCNRVAGAVLVPSADLVRDEVVARYPAVARDWSEVEIKALAHRFSVSREVIVRRLLIVGRTSELFYKAKRADYQDQLRRDQEKEEGSGGPESRATRAISTLGPSFIRLVLEGYYQQRITLSEVAGIIGERVKWLPEIEQKVAV
jgi:Zn-dependent peptidase ImmA (M78 family)